MYPQPIAWLILVSSGLFGLNIGSFLNVCIYRLPNEYLSIVKPRSHCTNCGKMILWYDNIPLLSWVLLGGSCRYCRNIISIRYFLVELLTGILFMFYTHYIVLAPFPELAAFNLNQRWIYLILTLYLTSCMIVITFIDIDFRIIPDTLTYPGIILAPIISTIFPVMHPKIPVIENVHLAGFVSSILGIIVGGGSLYFIGVLGKILFRKDAMGFGDVKMMAMVGGMIGWDSSLLIFLIACFLGTILGIILVIITKDHYMPFGPYLAVGTLVLLIFKQKVIYVFFTLWPDLVSQWLGFSMVGGY